MEENKRNYQCTLFKEKVTVIQDLNRFPGDFSPTFQELGKLSDKSEGCLSSSPGQTQQALSLLYSNVTVKNNFSPRKEKVFFNIISFGAAAGSNSYSELIKLVKVLPTLPSRGKIPPQDTMERRQKATRYQWKGKSVKLTHHSYHCFLHQSELITYITNQMGHNFYTIMKDLSTAINITKQTLSCN